MIRLKEIKMKCFLLLSFLAFSFIYCSAQKVDTLNNANGKDSLKVVQILSADRYGFAKKDSLTELLLMVGKVALKQEGTIFYADSAVFNRKEKIVEAFKNVHINDRDSVHAYSDYLLYHTDTKIAILKRNVRLTDGKSNLYTEELQYDVNPRVGVYRNGGRVVNGTSVLTSDEGTYYADLKDFYFKEDVKLRDPQYYLESDSLLYNTNTEIATFIAETYIEDSAKRTVLTSEGYYDLKNKNASFGNRPVIHDGSMIIIANHVDSDDKTGMSVLTGNAIFRDTAEGLSVLANSIVSDRNTGKMLATQKPLMIITQDKDSTFIAADTLYSGRLSELAVVQDTILQDSSIQGVQQDTTKVDTSLADAVATDTAVAVNQKLAQAIKSKMAPKAKPVVKDADVVPRTTIVTSPADSTDRFFRAYHNVKIFSDSLQAVCDSLFYSGKDSIFRLFTDP